MPKSGRSLTAPKRRARRLFMKVVDFLRYDREWKFYYGRLRTDKVVRRLLEVPEGSFLAGAAIQPGKVIFIDCRSTVISTAVHECFHAVFPKKTEAEIYRLQRFLMRRMTAEQATVIHLLLADRLGKSLISCKATCLSID